MIISAQDLTRTRTCAAADCPNDAEANNALCAACHRKQARGIPVPIHITPPPLPETLRCQRCGKHKPDRDFPLLSESRQSAGGRQTDRRGRYCNCFSCERKHQRPPRKKRPPRATLPSAEQDRLRTLDQAKRARARARKAAQA